MDDLWIYQHISEQRQKEVQTTVTPHFLASSLSAQAAEETAGGNKPFLSTKY